MVNINVKRFSRNKVDSPPIETAFEEEHTPLLIPEIEPESIVNDDFLADLKNDVYQEEEPAPPKPKKTTQPKIKKSTPKPKCEDVDDDNNSLFDEKGSQIVGIERRQLLIRLQQYKELFKDQLKNFKVPKGASNEQLKLYLDECENIVSTSTIQQFMTSSILQSIKLVEGASSYTDYDITGVTLALELNPQFNSLCKQLYLKYHVFDRVPVEYQLVLVVASTAMVMQQKNTRKREIDEILNKPT